MKRHFGDVRLALITREMIEGFQRKRHEGGTGIRIDAKKVALDR